MSEGMDSSTCALVCSKQRSTAHPQSNHRSPTIYPHVMHGRCAGYAQATHIRNGARLGCGRISATVVKENRAGPGRRFRRFQQRAATCRILPVRRRSSKRPHLAPSWRRACRQRPVSRRVSCDGRSAAGRRVKSDRQTVFAFSTADLSSVLWSPVVSLSESARWLMPARR